MKQDDIRCGYPPAAGEAFEEFPWYGRADKYPLGVPLRVLEGSSEAQWVGAYLCDANPEPITTVHGLGQMTEADKRCLALATDTPLRVIAPQGPYTLRNCSVPLADPKIVAADAHAWQQEHAAQWQACRQSVAG